MSESRVETSEIALHSLPTRNRHLETVAATGHTVVTDSARAHGGTDTAADPISTLLASLLGCYNQQLRKLAVENGSRIETTVYEVSAVYDRRAVTWDEEVDCHFPTVEVVLRIDGDIADEQLNYFKRRLRFRCAVSAVLIQSGTVLTEEWYLNGRAV